MIATAPTNHSHVARHSYPKGCMTPSKDATVSLIFPFPPFRSSLVGGVGRPAPNFPQPPIRTVVVSMGGYHPVTHCQAATCDKSEPLTIKGLAATIWDHNRPPGRLTPGGCAGRGTLIRRGHVAAGHFPARPLRATMRGLHLARCTPFGTRTVFS